MIYCRHHRFLFLKTSKTAGTSIEMSLSRHCQPGDIVTPVTSRDEHLRDQVGGWGPAGYAAPFREYRWADWLKLATRFQKKCRFYNHMPASEVRQLLLPDDWDSAFRFCVARNPWDRAVSYYLHKFKKSPRPKVDDFFNDAILNKLWHEGPGIYLLNGQVAVNHVCRYESLADELLHVWQKIGLPGEPNLSRAKSGYRDPNGKDHYSEILTANSRERIGRAFADEIETMGYQF
jgi:hypothetical protein